MPAFDKKYLSLKNPRILSVVFIVIFLGFNLLITSSLLRAEESNKNIDDINGEIDKKNQEIDELERKIKTYEDSINAKREEALNLENEIAVLGDQITKKNFDIEKSQKELQKLLLEITRLESKIGEKEEEIDQQKNHLSELIKNLYKRDQKTYLEVTLSKNSLSEFLNQVKYLKRVQEDVQGALDNIKILKQSLEGQKSEEVKKKVEVEEVKSKLEGEKESLEGQKGHKNELLDETKINEQEFQQLVGDLKGEEDKVNSEIYQLETLAREKLREQEKKDQTEPDDRQPFELGPAVLDWPVASRRITARFHDPTYPYRYIFEHPAIDISAAHGTSVTAAADGIVAIAKNKDWVTDDQGKILYPAYNYVSIVHKDGLSTVYGHLSQILVTVDEYVRKGDIIGKSGATPGTAGAGRLTTGPHLHFEVRLNGIPVNPEDYLP